MEINGIPKEEVLKFLEKKSVKKSKYVVITFLDTFTESGEIFPVGTIFSTKYLKKIKQEMINNEFSYFNSIKTRKFYIDNYIKYC